MKILPLAAMSLAALLSACVTVPKDVAPREMAVAAAGLGLSDAEVAAAANDWWNAYGDPQLDRLMRAALSGNPTLAQATARVRAAQSSVDLAAAGLGPSIDYDASVSRSRFSEESTVPPPLAGTSHWQGRQGLDLSWDLDFWGRQASLVEQARQSGAATGLDLAAARLMIAGAVSRAYFDLDRSARLADLAQRTADQRREILEITKKRVGAGIDTNVELRDAEGGVPQANVDLAQAQADQARAVHLLAALSGQGAEAYAAIVRPQIDPVTALPVPAALPANLLGRRPDVLAARARVESATAGRDAAKASFYPDVNLTAFVGTTALGVGNLFHAAAGSPGIGPAISLPIFDAGRLEAQYTGATAGIDAAVAGYNGTVVAAVRDVSDQLTAIASLQDQVGQQQQALDAAEASYRLAKQRYDAGISNYLTVLNAETRLLSARRQHIELESALAVARVGLLLAVGGDFTPHSAALSHS